MIAGAGADHHRRAVIRDRQRLARRKPDDDMTARLGRTRAEIARYNLQRINKAKRSEINAITTLVAE